MMNFGYGSAMPQQGGMMQQPMGASYMYARPIQQGIANWQSLMQNGIGGFGQQQINNKLAGFGTQMGGQMDIPQMMQTKLGEQSGNSRRVLGRIFGGE